MVRISLLAVFGGGETEENEHGTDDIGGRVSVPSVNNVAASMFRTKGFGGNGAVGSILETFDAKAVIVDAKLGVFIGAFVKISRSRLLCKMVLVFLICDAN